MIYDLSNPIYGLFWVDCPLSKLIYDYLKVDDDFLE